MKDVVSTLVLYSCDIVICVIVITMSEEVVSSAETLFSSFLRSKRLKPKLLKFCVLRAQFDEETFIEGASIQCNASNVFCDHTSVRGPMR